jgi:hypothetical protein
MYHFPTIDMGYTSLMHILLVITDNRLPYNLDQYQHLF